MRNWGEIVEFVVVLLVSYCFFFVQSDSDSDSVVCLVVGLELRCFFPLAKLVVEIRDLIR